MKGLKQFGLLLCAGLVGALIGILATTQVSNLSAAETTGHEHALVAFASQKATCTNNGSRAYWSCPECNLYFSDADGLVTIPADQFKDWVVINKLGHQTNENYHIERKNATCAETGNIEYYVCMNGCGGYFTDAKCKIEIKDKNVTLAKTTRHNLSKVVAVPAKPATCAEPGYKEHFLCTVCHSTFKDQSCTQPSGDIILTDDHELNYVEYQPETCLTIGQKPHYDCAKCGQHFADEAGTEVMTQIYIDKKDHTSYEAFYTPAQNPTCETAGHHAYYTCQHGCGQKFRDIDCQQLFHESELIINPTGHNLVLTKIDPNATAQYEYDAHGDNYYHGFITYQNICTNEDCDGYHETRDYCGFGYFDQSNTQNIAVATSINSDHDLFIVDWATNEQNPNYATITLRPAETITDNAKCSDNGEEKAVQPMINNILRLNLTITAEQVAESPDLLWEFDWDGNGEYEQTIKIQVINFNN